jgi:hypothetical protein
MYVKLTDGDEVNDFNSLDNFDSYVGGGNGALRAVWKDWWTQPAPKTSAEVSVETTTVRSGGAMKYDYQNYTYPPYYSEVEADIAALDSNDPNWLETGVATLSLRFYGQAGNDVNEDMYIKLIDGVSPAQTATVFYRNYGDMNDVKEERWHVWNINIIDFIFANWDFDPSKVVKIIIGFGDGNTPAASDGVVFFEDIRLYKEYPPPEHSSTVEYDGYPEYIKEPRWHVWNIPLAEFNNVNLGNVAKIAIGFGDGTSPGAEPNGKGTVYFEDIILRQGPAEDIYYDGSVYLDKDPFENGYQGYPLLLKQDCRLIDAGDGYIHWHPDLIGKTTAWEGTPDNNVVDIGFHYFNWYYVNAGDSNGLNADLNQDEIVNFNDFAILANGWETIYDMNDLKILADRWLWVKLMPNVIPSFDVDPNNLHGYVEISIDSQNWQRVYKVFALIDGEPYGEFSIYGSTYEYPVMRIDTQIFANGPHQIKIVSIDFDLNVVCSQVTQVVFNNELSNIVRDRGYVLGEPFYLYAYSSAGHTVEILDYNGVKYSESFSGDINAVIPPEAFNDYERTGLYEIRMKDSVGNIIFSDLFGEHFDAAAAVADPCVKILVTGGTEEVVIGFKDAIDKIKERANAKFGSGSVKVLDYGNSTWDNAKAALLGYPNLKIWIHMSHGRPNIRLPYQSHWPYGEYYLTRAVEFHGVWVSSSPNLWENHDLQTELGFCYRITPKLNLVFFNCCYSACDFEFSDALGITPFPPEEPRGRAFVGWLRAAWYSDKCPYQYPQYLTKFFDLMIGDGMTILEAKNNIGEVDARNAGDISVNMTTLGLSEQFVHFDYPEINPSHSPP